MRAEPSNTVGAEPRNSAKTESSTPSARAQSQVSPLSQTQQRSYSQPGHIPHDAGQGNSVLYDTPIQGQALSAQHAQQQLSQGQERMQQSPMGDHSVCLQPSDQGVEVLIMRLPHCNNPFNIKRLMGCRVLFRLVCSNRHRVGKPISTTQSTDHKPSTGQTRESKYSARPCLTDA